MFNTYKITLSSYYENVQTQTPNSWAHLFADRQGATDHAWCVTSVLNRLMVQTDLCLDPMCHLLSV